MAKAIGDVLWIVTSVIFALTALILIWIFHEKITSFFSGVLLEGLKNFVCALIPGGNIPGPC